MTNSITLAVVESADVVRRLLRTSIESQSLTALWDNRKARETAGMILSAATLPLRRASRKTGHGGSSLRIVALLGRLVSARMRCAPSRPPGAESRSAGSQANASNWKASALRHRGPRRVDRLHRIKPGSAIKARRVSERLVLSGIRRYDVNRGQDASSDVHTNESRNCSVEIGLRKTQFGNSLANCSSVRPSIIAGMVSLRNSTRAIGSWRGTALQKRTPPCPISHIAILPSWRPCIREDCLRYEESDCRRDSLSRSLLPKGGFVPECFDC